jgi:radical SAM superfamily enzyme YgiQ (UPF0313 family)
MKGDKSMKKPKRRLYGIGKFWRQEVPKPLHLKGISRPYSRYGLSLETFSEELKKVQKPSAILVTSLMTYWYPGVKEVIRLAKKVHPGVPVLLGGIYARLCQHHASQTMQADRIVTGNDPYSLLKSLGEFGIPIPKLPPDSGHSPYPAFDLLTQIDYVCLQTSMGCPYRCSYCASHFLDPKPIRRDPGEVLEEILFWYTDYGVRDIAYYDDALLIDAEKHFALLLEKLLRHHLDLRCHTPNAVHINEITAEIANLMHQTGFQTIRLGLETSDFSLHRNIDNKIAKGDFERAVQHLRNAGFAPNEIGAYILMGLPGQSVDSVMETIDFVANTGAIPFLSEYSPIPHTALWEKAISHSEYNLASEPLFHNNTILPCWDNSQKKELPRLKRRVLEIRERYR